ncbi:MAG: HAD-IA family hydrolase [Nanoarchaeota archaeon]
MIDTVIFDIGGVLVDDSGRRININEHYGLPWNDKEDKVWKDYKTGKCTETEYWQRVLRGTYMQGREEEVALYARQIHASSKPGKANFLLPKLKPKYNLAILSNHSTEWTEGLIKNLELRKYCSPIIISSEVGLAKPNGVIYELTLREVNRLETPEKCVFIDDKIENIRAAEQVGIVGLQLTKEDTQESLIDKLRKLGVEV